MNAIYLKLCEAIHEVTVYFVYWPTYLRRKTIQAIEYFIDLLTEIQRTGTVYNSSWIDISAGSLAPIGCCRKLLSFKGPGPVSSHLYEIFIQ